MVHHSLFHLSAVMVLVVTALLPNSTLGAVCTPPAKRTSLIVADAGSGRDTIYFGHHPSATHGRDTLLCEHELPPPPPSAIFDLRFINPPGYEGQQPPSGFGQGFYHDYRQQINPTQIDTHRVRFQPSAGGYPMTVSWVISSLRAMCDSAWLLDEFGGLIVNVRMHAISSVNITNPAITSLLLIKFGAVEVPSIPILQLPADGAVQQPSVTTLVWTSVNQALTYRVQIASDSLFTAIVIDDSSVTGNSRQATLPVAGTTYYWRVLATNFAGSSGWSSQRSFSVMALPGAVQLLSPPNGQTGVGNTVPLRWMSAVGASSYRVLVSSDSLFAVLSDSGTVADTGFVASGFLPSTEYYWRVRGQNGGGYGPWSADRSFVTLGSVNHLYGFQTGWNMMSLPVTVTNHQTNVLFPTATSPAFAFAATGYGTVDSLDNGAGYWLKFGADETPAVTGMPRTVDTIDVIHGWNLIGSVTDSVETNSIIEIPDGIIQSLYYGYAGGYSSVSSLRPGRAYWVKANAAGKIVLGSSSVSVPFFLLQMKALEEE